MNSPMAARCSQQWRMYSRRAERKTMNCGRCGSTPQHKSPLSMGQTVHLNQRPFLGGGSDHCGVMVDGKASLQATNDADENSNDKEHHEIRNATREHTAQCLCESTASTLMHINQRPAPLRNLQGARVKHKTEAFDTCLTPVGFCVHLFHTERCHHPPSHHIFASHPARNSNTAK